MTIAAGPAGSTLTQEQEATLIERIRKLLSVARGSTHGGTTGEMEAAATEAAAAMRLAQKLLHDYNIGLDAVDMGVASAAQRADVACGHVDLTVLNEDWRYNLLRAVAKTYMCHVIGGRNALGARSRNMTWLPTTAHLVGLPQNRMVAQEVFLWVLEQLEGRGGWYGKAWADKPADVSPRAFRYGFFNGAAERIVERLAEATATDNPDVPSDTRAMVLARNTQVQRYVHQTFPSLGGFGGQNVRTDGGAHGMGYAAGGRVSFAVTRLSSGTRGALGSGR
jgi:hypothetical protein